MNIFATDPSPIASAQALPDKHLIKMILESAQILSTVAHGYGHDASPLYKPTHRHHPSVLWAGSTPENCMWLLRHGLELCYAYRQRFDRRHKTHDLFTDFYMLDDVPCICHVAPPTEFVFVGPAETPGENVHERYRTYLNAKYKTWTDAGKPPTWTNTKPPEWYKS